MTSKAALRRRAKARHQINLAQRKANRPTHAGQAPPGGDPADDPAFDADPDTDLDANDAGGFEADFTPVAMRTRHDGFTPERQLGFIEALAECGCVEEACRRIGISAQAAYALRRRIDAAGFREAWEAALDYAVRRLSDAMFSRAIHGVARPIFYKGEQIGERRYYDERAAMFILRYRDPTRYGAFMDKMVMSRGADGAARVLNRAIDRAMEEAYEIADNGYARQREPSLDTEPDFLDRDEDEDDVWSEPVAPPPPPRPLSDAERAEQEEERRQSFREMFGEDPPETSIDCFTPSWALPPPWGTAPAPPPASPPPSPPRSGPRITTFDNGWGG